MSLNGTTVSQKGMDAAMDFGLRRGEGEKGKNFRRMSSNVKKAEIIPKMSGRDGSDNPNLNSRQFGERFGEKRLRGSHGSGDAGRGGIKGAGFFRGGARRSDGSDLEEAMRREGLIWGGMDERGNRQKEKGTADLVKEGRKYGRFDGHF